MALKRSDSASMFDVLKTSATEEVVEKKDIPKATSESAAPSSSKPVRVKEKNEKRDSKEDIVEPNIKAYNFGIKQPVKEIKSVRKQFVLTPTQAKWLKSTASFNNMSENQVIESLIKMAMEETEG